jgi:hypothetical protein
VRKTAGRGLAVYELKGGRVYFKTPVSHRSKKRFY